MLFIPLVLSCSIKIEQVSMTQQHLGVIGITGLQSTSLAFILGNVSTTSPSSWMSTLVEKKSLGSKLGEMLLRTLKMLATLQMQGRCRKHLLLGSFTRMIDRSFRNQQKLLLPLCSLIPVHGPTG